MNITELEAFLKPALSDRRVSSAEKEALSAWLTLHAQTDQASGVVRHAVFEIARQAVTDPESTALINCLEALLKVIAPIHTPQREEHAGGSAVHRAFFSPGEACLSHIVSHFHAARTCVDICVFTITDNRITRAVLDAHRRGVKVRIITDNDKMRDEGSDIRELEDAGIPVKLDDVHRSQSAVQNGHMHHKFALFDDACLLNGSYNWTRSAADMNYENLIETNDLALVAAFRAEFSRLWNKF